MIRLRALLVGAALITGATALASAQPLPQANWSYGNRDDNRDRDGGHDRDDSRSMYNRDRNNGYYGGYYNDGYYDRDGRRWNDRDGRRDRDRDSPWGHRAQDRNDDGERRYPCWTSLQSKSEALFWLLDFSLCVLIESSEASTSLLVFHRSVRNKVRIQHNMQGQSAVQYVGRHVLLSQK